MLHSSVRGCRGLCSTLARVEGRLPRRSEAKENLAEEQVGDGANHIRSIEGQSENNYSTTHFARYPVASVCKATILGRLGAPPELTTFSAGRKSLRLSIATNEMHVNGDNRQNVTQWHSVYVSDRTPGFSYISQMETGSTVYVEGPLRISKTENLHGTAQYVNIRVTGFDSTVRLISRPNKSNSEHLQYESEDTEPF